MGGFFVFEFLNPELFIFGLMRGIIKESQVIFVVDDK